MACEKLITGLTRGLGLEGWKGLIRGRVGRRLRLLLTISV